MADLYVISAVRAKRTELSGELIGAEKRIVQLRADIDRLEGAIRVFDLSAAPDKIWLLGRLRHRRFYSLAELNAAIRELLRQQLDGERPMRRLGLTRRALFEELSRPNLNSLPAQPYFFAKWRVRRAGIRPSQERPRTAR